MKATDYISIGLGILSVILGILALFQSHKYKVLSDKVSSDQEFIFRQIQYFSYYMGIKTRNIARQTSSNPDKISLCKDELYIWKNRNFRACNTADIISRIYEEFPTIIHPLRIDHLAALLNTDNMPDDRPIVIHLSHQCSIEDLVKIRDLNNDFEEYGISIGVRPF